MGFIGYLNDDLVHGTTNQKAVALSLLSSDERPNVVDWEVVKEILRCHPVATEENTRCSTDNDPMGRIFVVELVSRNPPVDVVEQALRAYPDSLVLNVTCFFAACQLASPDVIRVLTRHCVMQNKTGCPFPWISMNHVTAQGARVMLEEYPQGVLEGTNESGPCPLDRMLFSTASAITLRKTSPQWWEKVKLMLTVAEFGSLTIPDGQDFHLLNALVRRITLIKPQVFSDPKESKDFLWLFHQLSVLDPCLFRQRDQHGDFPLHAILRGKFHAGPCFSSARSFILAFVQVHPLSARLATREGRLALHLALENGWPCHEILLKAAPDSLQLRDLKTGLHPFQTAACSSVTWKQGKDKRKNQRENELDVTFNLLREDPVQVARGLHVGEGMLT